MQRYRSITRRGPSVLCMITRRSGVASRRPRVQCMIIRQSVVCNSTLVHRHGRWAHGSSFRAMLWLRCKLRCRQRWRQRYRWRHKHSARTSSRHGRGRIFIPRHSARPKLMPEGLNFTRVNQYNSKSPNTMSQHLNDSTQSEPTQLKVNQLNNHLQAKLELFLFGYVGSCANTRV